MLNKSLPPIKATSFLAVVFFLSGFSSLIYQIVWQRVLTLHFGMGAVSITVIVSVYMLGLGLGALVGGQFFDRISNKVLAYFVIELLIGAFGLISLPMLDGLFAVGAGSDHFFAYLCAFLFLCGPTFLMGATLPVLVKIFNAYEGVFFTTVSKLYFVNTLGAAAGSLCASYLLISLWGLDTTVLVAAAINVVLALAILFFKNQPDRFEKPLSAEPLVADCGKRQLRIAYLCVLSSGFLAVGYEIVWFRIIGVLVKASPYAFSTVLSVYLLGIAIGSWGVVKFLQRRPVDKQKLFFVLQFLVGLYVGLSVLGYYYLTSYTSLAELTRLSFVAELHPPLAFALADTGSWFQALDILLWPVYFVLLPTIFMGACFPLLTALAGRGPGHEARTIGWIYFFNIVGNVLGGLVTGFLLLHFLPVEYILLLFVSAGLLFGLFVTGAGVRSWPLPKRALIVVALLLLSLLAFPKGGRLYEVMHVSPGESFDLYLQEGIDGVVVTYEDQGRVLNYINGLEHGGRVFPRWYYQTIEAMSHAGKVEDVLIIGYGTGSIAEMVLKSDEVRRVTLVEISRSLIKNLSKIPFFEHMLGEPRLDLIFDDGRRFLLNSERKYDLILIDPLRTTTSYSNNLYSHEFFALAARHLNEGGVFMTYMDEYRVMPKTVLSAFANVRLYNFFALGSNRPLARNAERSALLYAAFPPRARQWIAQSGRYEGDQALIMERSGRYPINRDMKPICEYYLGLAVREKLQWFK